MCGIVAYTGDAFTASKVVLEGLERLEYRGYDSAGIALIQDKKLLVRRNKGKLRHIRDSLEAGLAANNAAMGHTRWATHGRPSAINAHPHTDGKNRLAVAHNGIIENYLTLKKRLETKGYEFKSETDTEVIVHLLTDYETPDFLTGFCQALRELEGAYAITVLHVDYPGRVFIAKKNCPVLVGLTNGEGCFVASDRLAILRYTRDLVFLEDNHFGYIEPEGLKLFSLANAAPVEFTIEKISWDPTTAEKEGFKHFMLKEIHEQPSVFRNILGQRTAEETGTVILDELCLEQGYFTGLQRIIIVACGTAYYSGLVGKYVLEHLARIPVEVALASEFRYMNPVLDSNTLVLAVTQSGETFDTIAAIDLARQQKAKTLAIVNVQGSLITRHVDASMYLHAGPEIGVASTKAYMAMILAFELLGIYLANLYQRLNMDEARSLIHELKILPQKMENILSNKEDILNVAYKYRDSRNLLYLGRGFNYPTALEGALKLKELSYIHAEGYAAGEMKHGPIALLDEEWPIVAILTNTSLYEKTISNVMEARSRGCRILAIATEGDDKLASVADDILFVPETAEMFSPMLAVLPLQLLAYYIADLRGTDVDQPRNLAKSVTVE